MITLGIYKSADEILRKSARARQAVAGGFWPKRGANSHPAIPNRRTRRSCAAQTRARYPPLFIGSVRNFGRCYLPDSGATQEPQDPSQGAQIIGLHCAEAPTARELGRVPGTLPLPADHRRAAMERYSVIKKSRQLLLRLASLVLARQGGRRGRCVDETLKDL